MNLWNVFVQRSDFDNKASDRFHLVDFHQRRLCSWNYQQNRNIKHNNGGQNTTIGEIFHIVGTWHSDKIGNHKDIN